MSGLQNGSFLQIFCAKLCGKLQFLVTQSAVWSAAVVFQVCDATASPLDTQTLPLAAAKFAKGTGNQVEVM